MLTVHHLADSRSQRILWMLEELGAEYQVVRYERDPATKLAPPSLRAVHPLGKAPVIDDGGVVMAESGAIVEYLAETFDALRPPGSAERRRATTWVHFAEGSMMTPLLLKRSLPALGEPAAAMLAGVDRQLAALLSHVEAELGDAPYLAGSDLSTADIMMSYPLEAAAVRVGLTPYPGLSAYLGRIHARPAYAAALERGGPYHVLR